MGNKNTANILTYNSPDYDIFYRKWKRCRDLFAGEDYIKSLGHEYLPQSGWHKKGGAQGREDYKNYVTRANIPDYFKKAIHTILGVLQRTEPAITLPKELEFMRNYATPYKDGLVALLSRLNAAIFLTGCAGLSLDTNESLDGKDVEFPFCINLWQGENIKDKDFKRDSLSGETYLRWVLLDESDYEFRMESKTREKVDKWRIMALDEEGKYYTGIMNPEDWVSFNFDKPTMAANPQKSALGEVIYPMYRGMTSNRVPFTFVNATDLSGGHHEDPPLYALVQLVFAIYRKSADHEQTLHFTASDFYKLTGWMDDEKLAEKLVVGAGGLLKLPTGMDIDIVSSKGGGASMQKESLDGLHEQCQNYILSLLDVGANQSGLALQLIQGSKAALIEPINENTGNAIEEQLKYADMWMGASREDASKEIQFIPAKIAETKLEIAQLISLWGAKKNGEYPITDEDFHGLQVKSDITKNDFDTNQRKLEEEKAAALAQSANGGSPLPGEPVPGNKPNIPPNKKE